MRNWRSLGKRLFLLAIATYLTIASLGCDHAGEKVASDEQQASGPVALLAPFTEEEAKAAREKWAAARMVEVEFTNSIGMRFNLIPPGKFKMGSPESELGLFGVHAENEFQHEVEISNPFLMGVYEVTQLEYEEVMGENPAWFSSKSGGMEKVAGMDTRQFPVEMVSWEDVQAFLKALNDKERGTGRYYRLPTEAEWEYVCRAGSETPFFFGHLNGNQANFNGYYPYGTTTKGRQLDRTARVGSYNPNAFGLYDMHGNVEEWCQDKYDKDYYKNSPLVDPPGPDTGSKRVLRGGPWYYGAVDSRAAHRSRLDPSLGNYYNGFRVLCELK